jgi:hypothetical protein
MILGCMQQYNSADRSFVGRLFLNGMGGGGGCITEENRTMAGCVGTVCDTLLACNSGMLYLYTFPFLFCFCSFSVVFSFDIFCVFNTLRRHLYVMGLSNGTTCRKCGTEEETSVHILCECQALASFWALRISGN